MRTLARLVLLLMSAVLLALLANDEMSIVAQATREPARFTNGVFLGIGLSMFGVWILRVGDVISLLRQVGQRDDQLSVERETA